MKIKELDSKEKLVKFLNEGATWQEVVVQGLEIDSSYSAQLLDCDFKGSIFLGCHMDEKLKARILATGGLYFPNIDGLPYKPFRGKLYDRQELYDNFDPGNANSYVDTTDSKIYNHYCNNGKDNPPSIIESLSQRLHDHSVTDALMDFLEQLEDQNRVVAIMGGHELERNSPDYKKAAEISYHLSRAGYLMISGGGPGAMEATHLGVWLSGYEISALYDAIRILSKTPKYNLNTWLTTAYEVILKYPFKSYTEGQGESIGIPTWLYGHEPATPFASKIAKYFANSVREEGLLAIAKGGVIYAPGSAGTVQEIFQDACQNHYKVCSFASPMIFLNKEYWQETKPVYPLLSKLADGREYGKLIYCSDDIQEILEAIKNFNPLCAAT